MRDQGKQKAARPGRVKAAYQTYFNSHSNRILLLMVMVGIYGAAMALLIVLAAHWIGGAL